MRGELGLVAHRSSGALWAVQPTPSLVQLAQIPRTGGSGLARVAEEAGLLWGSRRNDWPGQPQRRSATKSSQDYGGEGSPAASDSRRVLQLRSVGCSFGCPGTAQPCSPLHLPPAYFEAPPSSKYQRVVDVGHLTYQTWPRG